MRFPGTTLHALTQAKRTNRANAPGVETTKINLKNVDKCSGYGSLKEALANEGKAEKYESVKDSILDPIDEMIEHFQSSNDDCDKDWNTNSNKVILLGQKQWIGRREAEYDGGAVLHKNGNMASMGVSVWSNSYQADSHNPDTQFAYHSHAGTKTYVKSTPSETTQVKIRGNQMTVKSWSNEPDCCHEDQLQFPARPDIDKSEPQPLDVTSKFHYGSVEDAQEARTALQYYEELQSDVMEPVLQVADNVRGHDGQCQDKAHDDDHVILVNHSYYNTTDAEVKFHKDELKSLSARTFRNQNERAHNGSGAVYQYSSRGSVETFSKGAVSNYARNSEADYSGTEVVIDHKKGTFQEFDVEDSLNSYGDHGG